MTMARAHLVDPSATRWYHCVTRCVRRAFLLGEGADDRKGWIEIRLQELADIFAVAVGGFSVMDNHLHVLVRLDPDVAKGWSDEQAVRRWGALFPPRDKSRQPLPVSESWVEWRLNDAKIPTFCAEDATGLSHPVRIRRHDLRIEATTRRESARAVQPHSVESTSWIPTSDLRMSGRLEHPVRWGPPSTHAGIDVVPPIAGSAPFVG